MELMQASRQWASRPDDERFTSLTDMLNFSRASQLTSVEKVRAVHQIEATAIDENGLGIAIDGEILEPTNWAFGQLAQRVSAPAHYLRKLPAKLAADCINDGISRESGDLGILSRSKGVRAFTGPTYGRIWNAQVIEQLVGRFGDGLTGDYRVPGEFGQAVKVTKENTTLYASDRDMFVFLADEVNKIEVPNRRNGKSALMSSGFFTWNSEVGSGGGWSSGNQTLGIMRFFFDYACSNRIVWGAECVQEIRIRHTAGAPLRFLDQVQPALDAYAAQDTSIIKAITDARSHKIGDVDDVEKFLNERFTKTEARAIELAHLEDEHRPIETLWDAVTGATAYARQIPFQDQRVAFERKAGKILDLAA